MSNLEKIRTSKGISQRKLETLSGIHQQTISRYEQGVPLTKIETAKKLAKALGCKVSDIIDVDKSFDNMSVDNLKNVHNYLKATREMLDLNPRRVASFLGMSEKEYLDYENPAQTVDKDEALSMAAVMMFCYAADRISTDLKRKSAPADVSEIEADILNTIRSLSLEDQERAANLIKALRLTK